MPDNGAYIRDERSHYKSAAKELANAACPKRAATLQPAAEEPAFLSLP